MKSLKDNFYQAITAFICFVINLLSGENKKREESLLTASSCENIGNVERKMQTQKGTRKIGVPCEICNKELWKFIFRKRNSNRTNFVMCANPHCRAPDTGS